MEIVFVSNYYNHHQAALAECFDIQSGHHFVFIETAPISVERKNMGWSNADAPNYVRKAYESDQSRAECQELINRADVVIWGSCPFSMIRPRLKAKKLTFCYSERLFKKGFGPIAFGGRAIKHWLRHWRYQKNHYLLCASAYAADDYAKIGLFRNRAYKWGYFPEFEEMKNPNGVLAEKEAASLLWAGRMIDWKHPDAAVRLAKRLKDTGAKFRLDMIGSGEKKPLIEALIDQYELNDCVVLHDSMSPKAVREKMKKAEIYLFTSDHNEGWGAVLNESMNSACAVIANKEIGSASFLIQQGVNGLMYADEDELFEMVKEILVNHEKRKAYGVCAYKEIEYQWCAERAAERLLQLIELIQRNGESTWKTGPCSRA